MKKIVLIGLAITTLVVLPFFGACTTSAPETEAEPAAPQTTPPAPTDEVITLKYSGSMPETAADTSKYFLNAVEEYSNGRVKIESFWGGVLGSPPEMLNMVSSGAVDLTQLITPIFVEQMPFHNFPEYQLGGAEKTMDYVNKLNFEIPETSALMEEEFKALNIKGLSWLYTGEDGMLATTEFDSLADLKGKKLGAMKPAKALVQLGLNEVMVLDSDLYESLARGVCDCANYDLSAVEKNRWYEVAKCYRFNGFSHGGWQFVVNLDAWNSLPADIQEIFTDAAADTEKFSIELETNDTADRITTLEGAGLVVGQFSETDTEEWFRLNYEIATRDLRDLATKIGKTEEMEILLKHVDELTWSE
jgi:TRAP-type C4-dicarboxylate transport system substrate-binding protein